MTVELSAEAIAGIRKLCRYAALFAEAAQELEELLPPQQGARDNSPGRPVVVPTPAQVREVLRLRHSNGAIGMRTIGKRVGLSWRVVERILDENSRPKNPPLASQNPSRQTGPTVPSKRSRKGGETTKKATDKT